MDFQNYYKMILPTMKFDTNFHSLSSKLTVWGNVRAINFGRIVILEILYNFDWLSIKKMPASENECKIGRWTQIARRGHSLSNSLTTDLNCIKVVYLYVILYSFFILYFLLFCIPSHIQWLKNYHMDALILCKHGIIDFYICGMFQYVDYVYQSTRKN